jgi:TPR repeat protein
MIRLFEIFSVLFFVLLFCGIANCDEPEDSQCLRDVSCKDNKGYDDVINYFVKVVESGNSVSRYHLSSYYFDGFVTRNDIEFCKWLQNTLERERIKSMTNLANLYYEIEDYKESAKWFEKAAKLGNSYAQYKLGLQYYEGRGVKQDKESAMYWFILAAEQGESPIIIGAVALKCIDERKFDRAERYALKAADSGLAETKLLCFTFYCGHFPEMPKNFEEAIRWCRKAVEQEYAPAQYLLGIASHLGMYGVAQDNEEAAKWFRKAAEQGDASAQGSLGALYAEGKGVKQDFKEAAKWFCKAAEQGDVQAQGALGGLYAEGKGVKKDMKEAYKWIRQSAEQGLPRSQAYLGQFYLFGFEYVTKRDPKEAAKWFEKAAMQDDAMGQRHLAILFLLGDGGLAQNNEEALKLLQKAAEKGDNVAQCFLGLMYADMLENVDTAIKSLLDESKKQDDNTIGKDWIGPASREISVPKRDFNYWLDLTSSWSFAKMIICVEFA